MFKRTVPVVALALLFMAAEPSSCSFSASGDVTGLCNGAPCPQTPAPEVPVTQPGETGTLVSVTPTSVTLPRGGSMQFDATVDLATGQTDEGVVWSETGGTVDGTGKYTAPAQPGVYYVIARSAIDRTAQAVAKIEVKQVWVTITPAKGSVLPDGDVQFRATVTGTDDGRVAWSIAEGGANTNGRIDENGNYRAPTTPLEAGVTIRATSVADPSVRAEAKLAVTNDPALRVVVHPAVTTLETNESLRFHAEIWNGELDDDVVWSLERIAGVETGGAIVSKGMVVAGGSPGRFRVRATSNENPTISGTAEVSVVAPVRRTIRGIIRADPPSLLTTAHRVMIAGGGGGIGATTRLGAGAYRIRGTKSETWPKMMLAWVDSGTGTFRPTKGAWGWVELAAEPGAGDYVDVLLKTVAPPTTIPKADPPRVTASGTALMVTVQRFSREIGPDVLAEDVDGYEIQLATDVAFTSNVQSKSINSGYTPFAIFSGLTASTGYRVRVRGTIGSTAGEWSNTVTIQTVSSGGSGTITGKLEWPGLSFSTGRAYVITDHDKLAIIDDLGSATTHTYSIGDLPLGFTNLTVCIDENGSGTIDAGELLALNTAGVFLAPASSGSPPPVTRDITLTSARATARLVSVRDSGWRLEFEAGSGSRTLVKASLTSGPAEVTQTVGTPLDLEIPEEAGPFRFFATSLPLTSISPGSKFVMNEMTDDGWTTSQELVVTAPPPPVTGLTLVFPSASNQPKLTWTVPTDTAGIAGIHVAARSTAAEYDFALAKNATEAQMPELAAGDYAFTVTTYGATGNRAEATITGVVTTPAP